MGGCRQADREREITYVNLCDGYINNTTHYNKGIKRVPCINKIMLDRKMKKKRREEKIRKKTVTHEHLTHIRKIIKPNDGCEKPKNERKPENPMMAKSTWDLGHAPQRYPKTTLKGTGRASGLVQV